MRTLITLLFIPALWGADQTAANCSVAAVTSAIGAASNGDRVIIPDGDCTWASGITTSKQIEIRGQHTPTRTYNAGDGTTIRHNAGSATLLDITTGSSFHTTVSNLRFMPGTDSCAINGGCGSTDGVYIEWHEGSSPLVAFMHDVYFNMTNFEMFHGVGWNMNGGVIWNTTFESIENLGGACGAHPIVGSDSGSLVVKMSKPWTDASTMGTADTGGVNNLYIEDSSFIQVGQSPDLDDNSRVVFRHNTCDGCSGLTHGTTGAYGGRHVEIYNNTFTKSIEARPLSRWFWFRSGTAVITDNTLDALQDGCYGTKASFQFIVESATRDGTHGCCTGYMCWHQPGSGSDGTQHTPAALDSSQHETSGNAPDGGYQISDPVYMWNNSGSGATGYSLYLDTNDQSPSTCAQTGGHPTTTDFFVSGTDYFVDAGAKSGYAKYTYPHPLRSGGAATPTVSTTTATSITTTTASSGGNVTDDGGDAVTARGVCYATSSNPTTPCTSDGTGTGSFTSSLTGLSINTLYHYRAFATNGIGTSYGSDLTFTTSTGITAKIVGGSTTRGGVTIK